MTDVPIQAAPLTEMLKAAAERIIGDHLPHETIMRGGDDPMPFFQRWYILRSPSGGKPSPNLYVHHFLRSDMEEPHCHPWANTSYVLKGAIEEDYWPSAASCLFEDAPVRLVTPAGAARARPASAVHRIVAVEPGTISLFVTGPKVRDWGFYTDQGFIPHHEFRAWKQKQERRQLRHSKES